MERAEKNIIKANNIFNTIKEEYSSELKEGYLKFIGKYNDSELEFKYFNLNYERINNYQLRVETLLYLVAELSMPLNKLQDGMEKYYYNMYPDDKEKAKSEFLLNYGLLHKPYDDIKGKCWSMIFKLNKLNDDGLPFKK